MKIFNDYIFENFTLNSRKTCITAVSENRKFIVKFELEKYKNKNLDIKGEYEVIKLLNEKDCQTCPKAFCLESIDKKDLSAISGFNLSSYKKEKFHNLQ